MSEATPRPWEVCGREIVHMGKDWGVTAIVANPRPANEDSRTPAERIEIDNPRWQEGMANARLIVRAVNSHDALLAALISARAFIPKNQQALRDSVNAAIAAAEASE